MGTVSKAPHFYPKAERCRRPQLSVIVPHQALDSRRLDCLSSILPGLTEETELVIVADGVFPQDVEFVSDKVVAVALPEPKGAAAARNHGASIAQGGFLLFLDSDVQVTDGFFDRLDLALASWRPGVIFQGVYAAHTTSENLASCYKNLYYRFNFSRRIRTSTIDTLSSHCVVIHRDDFEKLNGFDGRYPGASIEDAELGLRARNAGMTVRLLRDLEVIHVKRYSVASLLATDFRLSRYKVRMYLSARSGILPRLANLTVSGGRLREMGSVLLSVLLAPVAWLLAPVSLFAAAAVVSFILALNFPFLRFLRQHVGTSLIFPAALLALLDYTVAFAGVLFGVIEHALGARFQTPSWT